MSLYTYTTVESLKESTSEYATRTVYTLYSTSTRLMHDAHSNQSRFHGVPTSRWYVAALST
jgi:hypothetical protein